MSDYSRLYDFSAKDALATGDANKLIKGSEVDGEFDAVVTAVATKYDSADLSSQAQAEAGTLNTVLMTPLRVEQWGTNWLTEAHSWTGVQTFTGNTVHINSVAPTLRLTESDADTDDGVWQLQANGENLLVQTVSDDLGTVVNALRVLRTDTVVDEVEINATTLDFNGALELSGDANIDSDILMIGAGNRRIEIRDTGSANASNIDLLEGSAAFGVAGSGGMRLQYDATGNVFKLIGGNGSTTVEALSIDRDASALNLHSLSLTTNNDTADEVGYKGAPQTAHSSASSYPIVLTDAGKQIYLTGSATGATIPANASVAFPIGTAIMIVNDTGGSVTIPITTDTLEWALDGSTGTRTLADNGLCAITKVTATVWKIAGTGLT